ncbi:hypothetical protein Poli38472_000823 [Pythium oligandrum]|uniref:beta-glucosidase n=1 Tax=Pythium oligandrum TaxID=41045 RepID=A0A8K1FFP8_PYTOL|nr:hypothetical protein Poli38472_000823 [Pythium oligandrum]|eukprot:TMW60781.1 hypothetical protein Poli38472_000823 [Pythium oligandrum]
MLVRLNHLLLVSCATLWSIASSIDLPIPFPTTSGSPDASLDVRTDEILAKLTLDDIVGLMTQINIGSVFDNYALNETKVRQFAKARVGSFLDSPFSGNPINGSYGLNATEWRTVITRIQEINMEENGGHPIIYGIDSVHGAIYVHNATLFGQQINAGASFNPTLVREMGRITGEDTLAGGMSWIFGPILEVSQNPLWARTYETFGEDPYLVSVMGDAIIRGMQSTPGVPACMKHFVAYSKTVTGHDRAPVTLTDFDLLNYFVPPFIAAVKAGALTTMENYISINGVPVVASNKILTQLLRNDMGYEGLVVTDWGEIYNLYRHHRLVRTQRDAVATSLAQTTLDMSMVPNETTFIDHAKELLEFFPEYLDRMKQSARRIIKTKLTLGLYENPVPGEELIGKVGRAEDRLVALNLARESIVLLQNNDNILPLSKSASVFLTGHSADNIGHLCGGWTLRWQGYSGNDMFPNGISFRQGIEALADKNKIKYFNGLSADGSYSKDDLEKAKSFARDADYVVAVIGEATYAEKPGDINDLALPAGQIEYVKELISVNKKVILILAGGRPRLLNGLSDAVPAVINALLPGEVGGKALAEIVYGVVNPSGRLPITYPRDAANILIPYNHPVSVLCADSKPYKMEWEFGAGLSYTTFKYGRIQLSKTSVRGETDFFNVSVNITNTGKVAGKETVMLFVIQPYRIISTAEQKQLKKFQKIELAPGKSTVINFTLTFEDWSVFRPQIGQGFARIAEPGPFVVALKPETDCDVYNERHNISSNPLCAEFTVLSPVGDDVCYSGVV